MSELALAKMRLQHMRTGTILGLLVLLPALFFAGVRYGSAAHATRVWS